MRKLIAAMKISLDGKSDGPEGYADWVDSWSEDYGLTERIDACILGGRMYPGYEQYWSAIRDAPDQPLPMTARLPNGKELAWSAFAQETPHYVLSSTLADVKWPHTSVLRQVDDLRALMAQPGKDIYLMGGAEIVGRLTDLGLVDELHLIVYPLLVGPANSPFAALTQRRALKLVDARALQSGLLRLTYQILSA